METFKKTFYARWGDMDFNGHMRNTAYLDTSGDVRMMFFAEHGFSMREFERRGIGPVILKDELEYFRELRLLEPFSVTLAAAGMSEDLSHFLMVNEFARQDGKRVARVASTGGWLDLAARKLAVPPPELCDVLRLVPRTEGIAVLPSRLR